MYICIYTYILYMYIYNIYIYIYMIYMYNIYLIYIQNICIYIYIYIHTLYTHMYFIHIHFKIIGYAGLMQNSQKILERDKAFRCYRKLIGLQVVLPGVMGGVQMNSSDHTFHYHEI